jgi:hypothetical protein
MAKKKTKKKSGGGGKRMSGVSISKSQQDEIYLALGVLGGAIGKNFIDTALAKQGTLKVEQKTVDGLEILAAAAGFLFAGDQAFIKGLSIGVGAAAAVSLLKEMDVLKGAELPPMVPFRPRPKLNGVTQTPAVAAANAYGFNNPAGVGKMPLRRAAKYAGSGS